MFKLFGFTILTPKDQHAEAKSIAPPVNETGGATVYENGFGAFGATAALDLETDLTRVSEVDLINTYRSLALQPEVDEAINDVVNELVVRDDDVPPVSLDLELLPDEYDDDFRRTLKEEFEHVLELLKFNDRCYEIARDFYVDGRLYYDLVVDNAQPGEGILETRRIDPRCMRPVRQIKENIDSETGARTIEVTGEYFLYDPRGFRSQTNTPVTQGVTLTKDRVAYVNSGVYTPGYTMVLSHLQKAIKPFNQLRMVEDATVIYRITRAPERRVFYIDVGDLPPSKAEEYLHGVASRYRNRVVYDSATGEVRDDRKIQSMLEDYFLPRKGSTGKGTEVTTLPGGENLGKMEDVLYFKRKLYKALNVPISRIDDGNEATPLFQNKSSEISRDEIKYARFLTRLRSRFSTLFDQIMSRHLTLKQVIREPKQWEDLRRMYIRYDYVTDSHFTELKDLEILNQRLDATQKIEPYIGRYFSNQFVRDRILRQTSDEQEQIDLELEEDPDQQPHDQYGNPIPALDDPNAQQPYDPTNPNAQFGGAAVGSNEFGGPPANNKPGGFGGGNKPFPLKKKQPFQMGEEVELDTIDIGIYDLLTEDTK